MKNITKFAIIVAVVFSIAASAPVVTDSLMRIQWDSSGTTVTSFFQKTTTIEGQTFTGQWEPVTWASDSTKTVTYSYGGQTFTQPYAQATAFIAAIANQERVDQGK